MTTHHTLTIGHLYPEHLNLYGDRGNILSLVQRCLWRGIEARVVPLGFGNKLHPEKIDLLFMGGGQDAQQIKVAQDLQLFAEDIKRATHRGVVFLGICGGYQLMGHYYQPHQGDRLEGLSLIDAVTVAGHTRMIGNISIQRPDGSTIVGFENHSGQTTLAAGVSALGRVLTGGGNNGLDKTEGVAQGNLYGTYLHGSLLPKNPKLADELITKALETKYQTPISLTPLGDELEQRAHERALLLQS